MQCLSLALRIVCGLLSLAACSSPPATSAAPSDPASAARSGQQSDGEQRDGRIDHHGNRIDAEGRFVHTNSLLEASSPYLRQHAHNPVRWLEWGEPAFAKARAENKPIFLSIGYSTCHWCHVMARESFSDEEVAALLNDAFVPIKVDREERPDVDEVYMAAAQAMGRRGGWPLSVWLTPDLEPFDAATYVPKSGFLQWMVTIQGRWLGEEPRVRAIGNAAAARVKAMLEQTRAVTALEDAVFANAVANLSRGFDSTHGGWNVPKFPSENTLLYLLARYQRDGSRDALVMALTTLDGMRRGGIHDQIGGGFARYSTDGQWLVPHFEKMLYNQAWLGQCYLEAYRVTADPVYRRAAAGIFTYLARDMTSPQGGFYSAEDADSEGEEGLFYLWRPEQVVALLGAKEGALANRFFGIGAGNFAEQPGTSIATAAVDPAQFAASHGLTEAELLTRLDAWQTALVAARARRERPARDNKIMADWNGYMIGALANAARVLDQPAHLVSATRAARFILDHLVDAEGRLLHQIHGNEASGPAFLDDYAAMIDGLLEIHESTGKLEWLTRAEALWDEARPQFRDPADGAFTRTGPRHQQLLARAKDGYDGARPSGNGLIAWDAVRLWRRTGEISYREDAEAVIQAFATRLGSPAATGFLLRAAEELRFGPQGSIDRDDDAVVTLSTTQVARAVAAGQDLEVSVALTVADGWHVNAPGPASPAVLPTTLAVAAPFALARLDAPPGTTRRLRFAKEPLQLWLERVAITAQVTVAGTTAPGPHILYLSVRTQPCNDTLCLKPRTLRLEVPLVVTAGRVQP